MPKKKPYVRKPVKGSPNSVKRAGERRDRYHDIGGKVGMVAGALPFVAGQQPDGNSLMVSPLVVPGAIVGKKVGEATGRGIAHVANLATLLRPDQFRDYL